MTNYIPVYLCSDPSKRQVYYNPKYEDMYAPVAGPVHPFSRDGLAQGSKNHKQGMVEVRHILMCWRISYIMSGMWMVRGYKETWDPYTTLFLGLHVYNHITSQYMRQCFTFQEVDWCSLL